MRWGTVGWVSGGVAVGVGMRGGRPRPIAEARACLPTRTAPAAMKRYTLTSRFWPMRNARS